MTTKEAVLAEPLVVRPGEFRGPGPLNIFDNTVLIKIAGADTGGNFAVIESITQPRNGPPLHRHEREDELFYVLEGEFEFEVDGKRILAGPGTSIYASRGTAHAFRNVGTCPGRLLVTVQPAGLDDYFVELSESTRAQQELDMSVIIPIFRKYGLQLLGPPLEDQA